MTCSQCCTDYSVVDEFLRENWFRAAAVIAAISSARTMGRVRRHRIATPARTERRLRSKGHCPEEGSEGGSKCGPGIRVERVIDPLRIPPRSNQASLLQLPQVIGHKWLRELQLINKVADTRFSASQSRKDAKTVAVAQKFQRVHSPVDCGGVSNREHNDPNPDP